MAAAAGDDFVSLVIGVVDAIPPGRVMTYGDVAAVLGSRAARGVGQTLARYGSQSPWWRVIRSGGHPPLGLQERALEQYRAENTPLVLTTTDAGYRVDYTRARWSPAGGGASAEPGGFGLPCA